MATRKEDLPEFPEDKVVESGLGAYGPVDGVRYRGIPGATCM